MMPYDVINMHTSKNPAYIQTKVVHVNKFNVSLGLHRESHKREEPEGVIPVSDPHEKPMTNECF